MIEKNSPTSEVAQIAFNWERVKKKASDKREELVTNAPKIKKRQMNTIAQTRTTDTITDPYTSIEIQAKELPSKHTPLRPNERTMTIDNPITDNNNNNKAIYNTDTMDKIISGTHTPSLLPAAPPQGNDSLTSDSPCEESLGSDRNAVELLQHIKAGSTSGSDLTIDERRLVVRSLRELGQTQDAIAELLKVSRRTIVNDYKSIRHSQALAIQSTDTTQIAGEVYDTAKICIRRALQAGSFKTVSTIMRDMVEVLQSLGILYRAPKTSMQATMHGDIPGRHNGYHKYMEGIGGDKSKVIDVLDCMFDAIGNDQVKE